MTGYTIKSFNNGTLKPWILVEQPLCTKNKNMELPVTGDRIFTRDGTYFQPIKQYYAIYKQFVPIMT